MATEHKDKGTKLPDCFTASDGKFWRLHAPYASKQWVAFDAGEDPETSKRYKAYTNEDAIRAFVKSDAAKGFRPPLQSMTDEEKATTDNVDFDAEDQTHTEEPPPNGHKWSGLCRIVNRCDGTPYRSNRPAANLFDD
ncbi:hypothetical protein [Spirosoma endophyticum]|uniref:Uncharacterized protein n=1 Tax=Spirosoma endophyticum TaxID=662367 RepID=A0A1I2G4G0_9BACT|nr:hypothetical protein [Spirosoma endophyticum]SFF11887.1 hypothetical protein SAMN05216167_12944 [Spirosoma endophyticum]